MVCDRVLGFGFSCCGLGNFGFLGVSGFYGLDFIYFFWISGVTLDLWLGFGSWVFGFGVSGIEFGQRGWIWVL